MDRQPPLNRSTHAAARHVSARGRGDRRGAGRVSARQGHSRLTFTHLNCVRLAFTVSVALTVWLGIVQRVTPWVKVCVPASAAVKVESPGRTAVGSGSLVAEGTGARE